WRASTIATSRTRPMSRAAWTIETMMRSSYSNQRGWLAGARQQGAKAGGQARRGPLKEPASVPRRQVHAAVAPDVAEVVVPERPVQAVALMKKHHPRHVIDGVVAPGRFGLEVVHVAGQKLHPDAKLALGGGGIRALGPSARGDQGRVHRPRALVGRERLLFELHVDPALASADLFGRRSEGGHADVVATEPGAVVGAVPTPPAHALTLGHAERGQARPPRCRASAPRPLVLRRVVRVHPADVEAPLERHAVKA